MKTILLKQKVWLTVSVLTLIFAAGTLAEGTKQFLPTSSDNGCIQVNDVGRPFALMTNTDPLQRLYFHISSTTEKVYFGFSRHSTSVASSGQYQIKNPSGTIVMGPSNIPNGGAGKIGSYAEAVAGPKIGGSPAAGYSPLSYTPVTTGDFYIEFSSSNNDNYRFEFFDLTVVNALNTPIDGRLWSYAWDLNTWTASNGFNGSFYVYTNEGYVSKVNMNGIQAYGFVTSCNGTGPKNTGNLVVDRMSVDGNSTRPDFKIFVNNPDITVYPSATAPTITTPVSITGGNIYYGSPVQFTVGVSAPGTMQFIISINGVTGYQAGTSDVLVVTNVVAGMNTINWDGKDAYGNYPAAGTTVEISTGFSAGITHLPIYDPETHPNGFIVDRVRPGTGSAPIRWDDSNFSGGGVNISGGSGNGHLWATNFGDVRTMNTWWNGYEVENQVQFTVVIQPALPIALTSFHIDITEEQKPVLSWATASETNIDYFKVERSNNHPGNFENVGEVKAFGNSNVEHRYSFADINYVALSNYYRIKAVDYDGREVYVSNILSADFAGEEHVVDVYPNPVANATLTLNFHNATIRTLRVEIVNSLLQNVFVQEYAADGLSTRNIAVNLPELRKGSYFIRLTADDKVYIQRFNAL